MDLLRRYLLDTLPAEERDQLRDRLLEDQDLSDQLSELETEIIDDLAGGRLSEAEGRAFREYLAASGQLHRLRFAETFQPGKRTRRFPWTTVAGALAALVLLAIGLRFGPRPGEERVETYTLAPGALRTGEGMTRIIRPPGQTSVRLLLAYQDTQPTGTCRATLQDASQHQVHWAEGPCTADAFPLQFDRALPTGRYTIELQTADAKLLHTYHFEYASQ